VATDGDTEETQLCAVSRPRTHSVSMFDPRFIRWLILYFQAIQPVSRCPKCLDSGWASRNSLLIYLLG
jgi:hypothetical protein